MKGVTATTLKRIHNPKGDIFHALRASEDSYSEFGEAYFTSVLSGEIKGWKKHTKMRLNLVVPVGSVTFFIHDEIKKITKEYTVETLNYIRLTVEPGLWVAFRGNDNNLNLVLNIASLEHDPDEAINVPLENIPWV